jgi:hypothetical protein
LPDAKARRNRRRDGTIGSDGYLYGTRVDAATGSAKNQSGTVFRGSTNGALFTLATFDDTNSGAQPDTTFIRTADGRLLGTTEVVKEVFCSQHSMGHDAVLLIAI